EEWRRQSAHAGDQPRSQTGIPVHHLLSASQHAQAHFASSGGEQFPGNLGVGARDGGIFLKSSANSSRRQKPANGIPWFHPGESKNKPGYGCPDTDEKYFGPLPDPAAGAARRSLSRIHNHHLSRS